MVFDLLYTLVHPGSYPGGADRIGWLANQTGLDEHALRSEWKHFEPVLEAGQAGESDPELTWIAAVAAASGRPLSESTRNLIEAGWDRTRRQALLHPPPTTITVLARLRERRLKIGVLSNTQALELRAWAESPIASLVDAVVLSYEVGATKPALSPYRAVLSALDVRPEAAAYVGDGSSDELVGARAAGFGLVVLAAEAPARSAPDVLSERRAQADRDVGTLEDLLALVCPDRAG